MNGKWGMFLRDLVGPTIFSFDRVNIIDPLSHNGSRMYLDTGFDGDGCSYHYMEPEIPPKRYRSIMKEISIRTQISV
jgi:hypothetical protein